MNRRSQAVRGVARSLCVAALLCAAAGVSAQTVHRQVDAAGRVTFTDRPEAPQSPRTITVASLDVANALASSSPISSRSASAIDANEATRRLAMARLARAQGAEPLPGERARGGDAGVVNHRYWRRQEKIRRVVEQALHRSNETRRAQRVPR